MSTFVLDRKFELQLPNSYVEIDLDEMEYVDGGAWNSYRGSSAVVELTNIIGASVAWVGITVSLVKACLASASTGFGVIVAVGAALGALVSTTLAATNLAVACGAANLYLKDKGFQVNSVSIFGYSQYLGFKAI